MMTSKTSLLRFAHRFGLSARLVSLVPAVSAAILLTGCSGGGGIKIGSPESLWLLWLVPALLVFYIYALQCLPTTAVVAREARSWKWATGQFFFMGGFANLASLLVFQLGSLLGF